MKLYISDNEYEDICDMLLIKKLQEDGTILSHYVLITNLSSLLYRQNKTGRKVYYCRRCLHHFRTHEKLKDHAKYCKNSEHKKQY